MCCLQVAKNIQRRNLPLVNNKTQCVLGNTTLIKIMSDYYHITDSPRSRNQNIVFMNK